MIEVDRYNLSDRSDVGRLGRDLGHELAASIIPLLKAMHEAHRLVFFTGLMAEPAATFGAAGGTALMGEALDWIKGEVERVAAEQARAEGRVQ